MDGQDPIAVREVTDLHSNWSTQGDGTDGKFSLQLILDNGAEEAVVRPTAEDTDVLLKLLPLARTLYFDTENRVLVFGRLKTD